VKAWDPMGGFVAEFFGDAVCSNAIHRRRRHAATGDGCEVGQASSLVLRVVSVVTCQSKETRDRGRLRYLNRRGQGS
jgi:hypothetical protein